MKHLIILLTLLLFVSNSVFSQDYQLSFAAAGDETSIETIEVQNLTQGTSLSLSGSDMLHLVSEISSTNELIEQNGNINIFPNPMQHKSTVNFSAENPGLHSIEILDIEGKKVISKTLNLEKGCHNFKISGLQSGIYLVNVSSETAIKSTKIIVNGNSSSFPNLEYMGITQNNLTKSSKEIVQMQYNDGDLLLFKAISGDFSSILTAIPSGHGIITFMFYACTDIDDNHYTTVNIGEQVWMAEDLRVTTFPNGEAIPNITDDTEWGNLADNNTDIGYCFYNNDNTTDYGALYSYATAIANNWNNDVADGQGVCPDGWHLPTKDEWTQLTDYLGGEDIAGGKLKETGLTNWSSPNTNATNEVGFTALPGGGRDEDGGAFFSIYFFGAWWSATSYDDETAWYNDVMSDTEGCYSSPSNKSYGLSVRCVKDE